MFQQRDYAVLLIPSPRRQKRKIIKIKTLIRDAWIDHLDDRSGHLPPAIALWSCVIWPASEYIKINLISHCEVVQISLDSDRQKYNTSQRVNQSGTIRNHDTLWSWHTLWHTSKEGPWQPSNRLAIAKKNISVFLRIVPDWLKQLPNTLQANVMPMWQCDD